MGKPLTPSPSLYTREEDTPPHPAGKKVFGRFGDAAFLAPLSLVFLFFFSLGRFVWERKKRGRKEAGGAREREDGFHSVNRGNEAASGSFAGAGEHPSARGFSEEGGSG